MAGIGAFYLLPRQPGTTPGAAIVPDASTLERARQGSRGISARAMAAICAAGLFLVSHHGGPRNDLHHSDGGGDLLSLATNFVHEAMAALGDHARDAISFHCQHTW